MDRRRVLIVGARGFLGSYAVDAAAHQAEVLRGDRYSAGLEGVTGGVVIDVSDAASVNRAFRSAKPDAVLLLAAMSDIDRCEAQPEEAFAVNVRGAENVANACAQTNARLVYASTAAVFDGRKQSYREDDERCPISVYGKTKAEAEAVLQALVPAAFVVRVSLVLGWARRSGTNSMLNTLRQRWEAGKSVSFPVSEIRNPIHAASAAEIMITLLMDYDHAGGIYHAGASDSMSRYEMGRRLAARLNVPDLLVEPQTVPIPGRAPRGEHHCLLTEKLQKLFGIEAQTCDQVIERCFS
ncbi:MAG: dTDP-4-dehydrorhamnose reductase [Acidobacteriaceae bacterium]|nr:dTDP-4-dehydrorhamnose reductase [Acidobacteriaceae bacterium]